MESNNDFFCMSEMSIPYKLKNENIQPLYQIKDANSAILKGSPEEGKILSVDEIEAMGYEFGLLTRVS